MPDEVNHPPHYNEHPSGIEAIDITEHFNFNLGNAIKYIWRAGLKGNEVVDLQKAVWYVEREIVRIQLSKEKSSGVRDDTPDHVVTSNEKRPISHGSTLDTQY
jgi:hypothetical protein